MSARDQAPSLSMDMVNIFSVRAFPHNPLNICQIDNKLLFLAKQGA